MDRFRSRGSAVALGLLACAAPVARGQDSLQRPARGTPYFEFMVDTPVRPAHGSAEPRYPDKLKSAGVEGMVLAQFVVDTNGLVEPKSFRVLRSTDSLFTAAVLAAVPQMRFEPAIARGAKVRQLVQRPFGFAVAGGHGPNVDSILSPGRARAAASAAPFQLPASSVAGPPPTRKLSGWMLTIRITVDSGTGRVPATVATYTGAGKHLRTVVEREGSPASAGSPGILLSNADSATTTAVIAATKTAVVTPRPRVPVPSALPHYERNVKTTRDTLGRADVLGFHTVHVRTVTAGTVTGSWDGLTCTAPASSESEAWITSDSAAADVVRKFWAAEAQFASLPLQGMVGAGPAPVGDAVPVRSRSVRRIATELGPLTVTTTTEFTGIHHLELSEADFAVPEGYRILTMARDGMLPVNADSITHAALRRSFMAEFDTSASTPASRRAVCHPAP